MVHSDGSKNPTRIMLKAAVAAHECSLAIYRQV
jgi:hypothetical protein